MKLKLYHAPGARSSRCAWVYYELEALYKAKGKTIPPMEIVTVDMNEFRNNKPADLLAANPNGKVPTLIVDEYQGMFEGMAIVAFLLDEIDTERLLRPSTREFRMAWHLFSFYMVSTVDNLPAVSSPIQRVMDNPRPGDDEQLKALNKKAFLEISGPILSGQLGDKEFFFGDTFTALDIAAGFFVKALSHYKPEWLDHFDNLKRYSERISKRETLQKAWNG